MIPTEFFIAAGVFVGTCIGALGVHLYHRSRAKSIQSTAWKLARIYFQNLDNKD